MELVRLIKDRVVPIGDIKPNPGNARTHPDWQVAQIARSIETYGLTAPLLVDEHLMLLAGEGRLLAAQKLGLEEVPVRVIEGLTETQKSIYVIADNQIALNATWDEDKLRAAVEELERALADLDLTGLCPQEIDRLIADLAAEQGWTDEDEAPKISPMSITAPGELWILDRHRVLCGDATSREPYESLLGDQLADMVFADLPYNVNYTQKRSAGPVRVRKIANDNLGERFEAFLHAACVQLLASAKDRCTYA